MKSTALLRLTLLLGGIFSVSNSLPSHQRDDDDREYHSISTKSINLDTRANSDELTSEYWISNAQSTLYEKFNRKPNTNVAKNIIFFLGDGMSIPTLAATRAYLGGEEKTLSFDNFPYSALSKTYCVNKQVADSACTATAYLCGVKNNFATIGVTATVALNDCEAMADPNNHVFSIGRWSQLKGKKAGLVSTTRVTDASPAGVYAHTAQRKWENNADVVAAGADVTKCPDIAQQLVYNEVGKELYVVLGGGRREFIPITTVDEDSTNGERTDGRNLIQEWLEQKANQNKVAEYVSNRDQLLNVPDDTEYLMGFFASNNMDYNLSRNKTAVPSLLEMTETAINILTRNNPNGFFLFVEGARIDHAHHDNTAKRAFEETAEFSRAIQRAVDMTSEEDTLIVVTADHAHTMSYSGYPTRHNDILSAAGLDDEGYSYLTINYANGPGYQASNFQTGNRYNLSEANTTKNKYMFPSIYPLESETHGGDDVAIFARGPWAHLYSGVLEQNVIPHVMAYAACVGDGHTACGVTRSKAAVARGSYTWLFGVVAVIVSSIIAK